jgi:hypothetical protein
LEDKREGGKVGGKEERREGGKEGRREGGKEERRGEEGREGENIPSKLKTFPVG